MFDFEPPPAAQALAIVQALQQRGFVAYLAGGCVRDALLGRAAKDFDVATDAAPPTVRDIFGKRKTLAFGASFGVIGVLGDAPLPTEVATFRSDGEYSDGRRPDSVRFGDAQADALRRDFTINGMFYDPVAKCVIDFVDGQADLNRQVIRAIGNPAQRFAEDKLRMLRAVRFAAALGFAIDDATANAIHKFAADVVIVSGERIGAELRRMFASHGAAGAIEMLCDVGLMQSVWPSFDKKARLDGLFLSDALRLGQANESASFVSLVAAIFARIEPSPDQTLPPIVEQWKLSGEEQRAIQNSIVHLPTILLADQQPWSIIQPLLASRDGVAMVDTAAIWASALANAVARTHEAVEHCRQRLAWPSDQLNPAPLVDGDLLRQLGYPPGPRFKDVLAAIRNQQLDGEITNQADAVALARAMLM